MTGGDASASSELSIGPVRSFFIAGPGLCSVASPKAEAVL